MDRNLARPTGSSPLRSFSRPLPSPGSTTSSTASLLLNQRCTDTMNGNRHTTESRGEAGAQLQYSGHLHLSQLPLGVTDPASPNHRKSGSRAQGLMPIVVPSPSPLRALPTFTQMQNADDSGEFEGKSTEQSVTGEKWSPRPLQRRFWIPLVCALVLIAMALEIALRYNREENGWGVPDSFNTDSAPLHFTYTLPPVLIAMFFVAMWVSVDVEIKKLQPFVDLSVGECDAGKTLMVDYTRSSNFTAPIYASRNGHWLVLAGSLVALATLCFQPLAAAIFVVKDTWYTHPSVSVNSQAVLGLNQDAAFQDLTVFLSAAGFASASVLYNIGDPSFVHDVYSVAPFEIPMNYGNNGSVIANTTAVKSHSGCEKVAVNMHEFDGGARWVNTATWNGCSFSWDVDNSAVSLFGTSLPLDCNGTTTPDQFAPVIFWFFTYQPEALASASLCTPSISLWDVTATVDIASRNLTNVSPIRPFNAQSSNFSANASSLDQLGGQAYNGIGFNMTGKDRFTFARANATQVAMPAAVFQKAELSSEGVTQVFREDGFADLSKQVYTTYLKLIANSGYFVPSSEEMAADVIAFKKRLWMTPAAVHALVGVLFGVAIAATFLQLAHRQYRANVWVSAPPGTLFSSLSLITPNSRVVPLLQRARASPSVLRDEKLALDREHALRVHSEPGWERLERPRAIGSPGSPLFEKMSKSWAGKGALPSSPGSPKPPASA